MSCLHCAADAVNRALAHRAEIKAKQRAEDAMGVMYNNKVFWTAYWDGFFEGYWDNHNDILAAALKEPCSHEMG